MSGKKPDRVSLHHPSVSYSRRSSRGQERCTMTLGRMPCGPRAPTWAGIPDATSNERTRHNVLLRLRSGSTLPSTSDASNAAISALWDSACSVLPTPLLGAERYNGLRSTPSNGVPEELIVKCMRDDGGDYLKWYTENGRRCLYENGIKKPKTSRKCMRDAYIDRCGIQMPSACKRPSLMNILKRYGGKTTNLTDPKKRTTALLLYPLLGGCQLPSEKPFESTEVNTSYCKTRLDLKNCIDGLQRYFYYMKPDDCMAPSHDTNTRLQVCLRLVSTIYKLCCLLIKVVDTRVACLLDKGSSTFVSTSDFTRMNKLLTTFTVDASRFSPHGGMDMLLKLCLDVLLCFNKLCTLWISTTWNSNVSHGGPGWLNKTIPSVVDGINLMHSMCQYMLNQCGTGYQCWLGGGLEDVALVDAMEQQGLFCQLMGDMAPTMKPNSWCDLERGTRCWFLLTVATCSKKYGGPTPHYSLSLGLCGQDSVQSRSGGNNERICTRHDNQPARNTDRDHNRYLGAIANDRRWEDSAKTRPLPPVPPETSWGSWSGRSTESPGCLQMSPFTGTGNSRCSCMSQHSRMCFITRNLDSNSSPLGQDTSSVRISQETFQGIPHRRDARPRFSEPPYNPNCRIPHGGTGVRGRSLTAIGRFRRPRQWFEAVGSSGSMCGHTQEWYTAEDTGFRVDSDSSSNNDAGTWRGYALSVPDGQTLESSSCEDVTYEEIDVCNDNGANGNFDGEDRFLGLYEDMSDPAGKNKCANGRRTNGTQTGANMNQVDGRERCNNQVYDGWGLMGAVDEDGYAIPIRGTMSDDSYESLMTRNPYDLPRHPPLKVHVFLSSNGDHVVYSIPRSISKSVR
nr:tegument protein VP11/12 UL46 [Psittacid alphaherpesvirus 6]